MIHTARLGDTATTGVGTGAQIASVGLAATQAAASAGLIAISSTAAAAIPVAGALIAVGVLAFTLLHNSRGLQQDAETTAVVNKAATLMDQNVQAWNASNKSLSNQAAALSTFDQLWQAVVNFCTQASEGSPGQRCVSERQRGGKYDFFAYYRDPIANDPDAGAIDRANTAALVQSVAANTQTAVASIASSTGIPSGILIPAALVLLAAGLSQ